MALLTIGPTRFDRAIAGFVEDQATPAAERALEVLTYAADGSVLLAAAIGFWALASKHRQREASTYLVITVAVSAVLPHFLKALVDQERPDRKVHGFRHGIPVSGKAKNAFPSGHAVHVGAVVSASSRYFPGLRKVAWPLGLGVAATRIFLLAHWASDVIAGLALGIALERNLWLVWRKTGNGHPQGGV
jgi:membrane-associated phospholipid phosphatase